MVNKRRYVWGAAGVLILLIASFVVLKDSPEFKTYMDSYLFMAIGVLLILAGVGYVLYYINRMKSKKAEREFQQVTYDVNKVQQKAQIQNNVYTATQVEPAITERLVPIEAAANDDRTVMIEEDATVPLQMDDDSTILLEYATTAVLKTVRNDHEEVVPINRPSFYIGRNSQVANLCVSDNLNIGRVHATIEYDNNIHYVVDLESLNGTFVNDSKIDSNIRWQLKFGDRLKFANIEYVFDRP